MGDDHDWFAAAWLNRKKAPRHPGSKLAGVKDRDQKRAKAKSQRDARRRGGN